jgi:N-acetylmuramate 1-kinase
MRPDRRRNRAASGFESQNCTGGRLGTLPTSVTTLPHDATADLTSWLGPDWSARPLAGDASVRAYYRVTAADGKTYILTYYPQEVRSQLGRFLGAYQALTPRVPVPPVLHHSAAAVLQRDAGDRTAFAILHDNRQAGVELYRTAIDLLVGLQDVECTVNRPFTAELFLGELEMALEFYVEKLMSSPAGELRPLMRQLATNVVRHPHVLCHRDFHGQNIHVNDDGLFLIDYQDVKSGPDTYDLASLLRDRGVARILGDETELELLEHYRRLRGAGEGIRPRYFETLLQRSIKILGTFSKQPIARGKMHYLDFIPATLESIQRCVQELPGYAALRDAFPMNFDLDAARRRAQELNVGVTQ